MRIGVYGVKQWRMPTWNFGIGTKGGEEGEGERGGEAGGEITGTQR